MSSLKTLTHTIKFCASTYKPSIRFIGKRTPEYWQSLHKQHSNSSASNDTPYVHHFSTIPRLPWTQEEIDLVNIGCNEVSDWKKVKPLPAHPK